jgi:outer membrane protein TolC
MKAPLILATIAPLVFAPAGESSGDALSAGPSPLDNPPTQVEGFDDRVEQALEPKVGGLTADEVAARASANSPTLVAHEAKVRSAKAAVDQNTIQFIPQIKGTAGYTRLSRTESDFGGAIVGASTPGGVFTGPCDPGIPDIPPGVGCLYDQAGNPVGAAEFGFENPLNQFSLQASLGVPFSDYILSLGPARKGSVARMKAAQYARDAERLQVEADARQAYYGWLAAVASVGVAEQSLEHTSARLVDAQNAFELGAASKADVMRLEAARASVNAALERSREYEGLAAQRLALIMGESGGTQASYAVGEDVLGPLPPLPSEDLQTLVDRGQANRLELKAMEQSIDGVGHGVRATRANYYPRLDGFAEATYANPNSRFFPLRSEWRSSWSAGLSLSWVMNQALMTKSRVSQYQADQAELEAQLENARRGIALEVSSAYAELRAARAVAMHQDQAVAASQEAYRVAVDLYRNGEATTTDVLEAESERVNTTLQKVNAHIDLRSAATRLEFATGQMALAEKPGPE